jgi:hypothetical protein
MSTEAPTITVIDRALLQSIQPEWPLIRSAPGGTPDGRGAGAAPAACDQEVRLVMCLLLA